MPTVFISYSWDGPEHKAWVRRFAGDLRAKGVDAWLDQWEVRLGDDVTQFMERGVSQADYVLLVCTENFARRANERHGGVGYEQSIVTSQILNSQPNRGRFVCVLRQGPPSSAIPRYMQARLWVDCRDDACPSPEVVLATTIDLVAAAVNPHSAMFKVLLLLLGALVSAFRNGDLVLEILALRQQLDAFASSGQRPRVTHADRWFCIGLRRRWARWSGVLVFVKPETVMR